MPEQKKPAGWGGEEGKRTTTMNKLGKDLLKDWSNELQAVYEVDGLDCANDLLLSIVRCVNGKPEIYGNSFLRAILRLKIVKRILSEQVQPLILNEQLRWQRAFAKIEA